MGSEATGLVLKDETPVAGSIGRIMEGLEKIENGLCHGAALEP